MSQFKIGIFQLPEPSMTNLEGVRYVHEIGLKSFEPFPQHDLAEPDLAAARRIREEADKLGMEIPCLSMLARLTGDGRAQEVERLKKYAEVARELGASMLHHTLCPSLKPESPRPIGELTEEAASAAREVYDYAASLGIRCVYEDQGLVFNGVSGFGKFLEALNRPAGVVLDLGNTAFVREFPDDFAKAYADRIVHVHVKDYSLNHPEKRVHYTLADGTTISPANLGEGDMHLAPALKILKASGYSGWYMLESERPEGREGQLDDIRLLREMLENT